MMKFKLLHFEINKILLFSLLGILLMCSVSGASDIVIYDENGTTTEIPHGWFVANKSAAPDATLTHNPSKNCYDFLKTSSGTGELFFGGMYPFTNGTVSLELGIDNDDPLSQYTLYTSETSTIWITKPNLNEYVVKVNYRDATGAQQWFLRINDISQDKFRLNLTYNENRTVYIYYNATKHVTIPCDTAGYGYEAHTPVMYVTAAIPTGSSTLHVYNIKQTIPDRGVITPYSINTRMLWGLDYPNRINNEISTNYMYSQGQTGTVWTDVRFLSSDQVNYTNELLAHGWELGIHFSTQLTALNKSAYTSLIDSETETIATTFGVSPTSWCSQTNADNVTHALYCYQAHGMLWRNGRYGATYIPSIGNLDNSTWAFWDIASQNGFIFPAFSHQLDNSPAGLYSIDHEKFIEFSDRYKENGIKLCSQHEYYKSALAQNETNVEILENDSNHMQFRITETGSPVNLNVKTAITGPRVYNDTSTVDYTETIDGIEFVASNGTYLISASDFNDFNSSIQTGNAPLSIQFHDMSVDADNHYWDFENDGIIDSTKQNPVHTYGKAGTYTVNLTVQNEYGNFSTVKTDYITVSEPAKQSTDYFSSQYFNTIFNTFYRYLFQLPMRLI